MIPAGFDPRAAMLDAVSEAHAAREQAERSRLVAIQRARSWGVTLAEIGTVLGMSRQGVFDELARVAAREERARVAALPKPKRFVPYRPSR